jgi:hypothetical protein
LRDLFKHRAHCPPVKTRLVKRRAR